MTTKDIKGEMFKNYFSLPRYPPKVFRGLRVRGAENHVHLYGRFSSRAALKCASKERGGASQSLLVTQQTFSNSRADIIVQLLWRGPG